MWPGWRTEAVVWARIGRPAPWLCRRDEPERSEGSSYVWRRARAYEEGRARGEPRPPLRGCSAGWHPADAVPDTPCGAMCRAGRSETVHGAEPPEELATPAAARLAAASVATKLAPPSLRTMAAVTPRTTRSGSRACLNERCLRSRRRRVPAIRPELGGLSAGTMKKAIQMK